MSANYKNWYPFYRRLDGPQGRSGNLRKVSPPPGFDPRTVQPVAIRYTDYNTRATNVIRQEDKTILHEGHTANSHITDRLLTIRKFVTV